MSVWFLSQHLTREEEYRIYDRAHVVLPFEYLPDLASIHSAAECRKLFEMLHPEDPPETIARRMQRVWSFYSTVDKEDIIAVPLKHLKTVALAEVTGRYQYQVGDDGKDVHTLPVKWHQKQIPLQKFRKDRGFFEQEGLVEITNTQMRIIIRENLPHRYNRFVFLKWIVVVFFLLSLVKMFERITHP